VSESNDDILKSLLRRKLAVECFTFKDA